MKYCPACRSQYSDPTLRFCLQDGAILHAAEEKQSSLDTLAFSDPATVEKILQTEELRLFAPSAPAQTAVLGGERPPTPEPATKRSASSRMMLVAVFPALLALVAVGLGGWFYLKNQNRPAARFADPADASTPENASKTPPANVSDPTSKSVLDELGGPANSNSESFSNTGSEDAKKEIADAVEAWRKAIEARRVPEYLSRYAEKVDYFDESGVGAAEIRGEAQKMFDTYIDIDVNLTNLRVAVDAENNQATAVFDKEWSYQTDKDLLEGKARTKLHFLKSGREWKIASEKYQRIYYMEN